MSKQELDRLRLSLAGALLDLPWSFKGYVAATAGECVQDTTDVVMEVVEDWLADMGPNIPGGAS